MHITVSRIAIIAMAASPLAFTAANATTFLSPVDPRGNIDQRPVQPARAPDNSSKSGQPVLGTGNIPIDVGQRQQMLEQIEAERERQRQEIENTAGDMRERAGAGSGDLAERIREQLQERDSLDEDVRQPITRRANSALDAGRSPDPAALPGDGDRAQQLPDARERLEAQREQREQAARSRQEELAGNREQLLDRLEAERERQRQENENAAAEARERAAKAAGNVAEDIRNHAQERGRVDDETVNSIVDRVNDGLDNRTPLDRGGAPGDSDRKQQALDARERLEAERERREQATRSRREELEGNNQRLLERIEAERQRQRQENQNAAAEARERAQAAYQSGGRFDVNARPSPEVLRDLVRNAPLEPITVASLAGFVRETPATQAPDGQDANTAEPGEEESSERNQEQLVERVAKENAPPPPEPDEEEPAPPQEPEEPTQPEPEPEQPEPEQPEPEQPDPGFPYHDAWMLGNYDAPDAPPVESLAGTATASFDGNVYGTFYGASNEDISGTISLNVDFGQSAIDGTMTFDNGRGQLAVQASWAPGENHVSGSLSGAAFGGEIREGYLGGTFLGPNGEELAGHWGGAIIDGLGNDLGGIEAGFMTRQ